MPLLALLAFALFVPSSLCEWTLSSCMKWTGTMERFKSIETSCYYIWKEDENFLFTEINSWCAYAFDHRSGLCAYVSVCVCVSKTEIKHKQKQQLCRQNEWMNFIFRRASPSNSADFHTCTRTYTLIHFCVRIVISPHIHTVLILCFKFHWPFIWTFREKKIYLKKLLQIPSESFFMRIFIWLRKKID